MGKYDFAYGGNIISLITQNIIPKPFCVGYVYISLKIPGQKFAIWKNWGEKDHAVLFIPKKRGLFGDKNEKNLGRH